MKIYRFPPLEPGREMDAVLAPPRNQLDHLENHWNSLHFQRPALMGDSARQRHPGGQCENLTVIGKPSKTFATVTFHTKSRIPYLGNVFPLVRLWLELRKMHTETLEKPLGNIAFPSILEEHGAPQETWASRRSPGQIKRLHVAVSYTHLTLPTNREV